MRGNQDAASVMAFLGHLVILMDLVHCQTRKYRSLYAGIKNVAPRITTLALQRSKYFYNDDFCESKTLFSSTLTSHENGLCLVLVSSSC